MHIYYSVQPRGAKFRVVDYEGYVFGPPFHQRPSAQSYADGLNSARSRGQLLTHKIPVPVETPVVSRPTLRNRLRALANKVFRYRTIRIGL